MASPLIANNAYQSAAQLARQIGQNEPASPATEVDFGQMVADAVGSVVESGRVADQKAIGMVEGKTDVVDVVTAIAETEVALETMVSVRDRVISAYEEIMRMPI
ncbi:flagellar hook-basal body complex protein FliE 1 [Roseibium aquae]|uniref:Flagellar hook-basal body complex protein FliE n=1 Tax=Roseibium aquae TaxID=1323746 RepID=A0A916TBK5_9HYPH|nr:flagellar hook-basal body complex protein FliE [Roseibium aquae]GGB37482.1 flagellar hook-basal body complex protein FliE 1 [Roseibium aquae]